jgi:hypothetical protein
MKAEVTATNFIMSLLRNEIIAGLSILPHEKQKSRFDDTARLHWVHFSTRLLNTCILDILSDIASSRNIPKNRSTQLPAKLNICRVRSINGMPTRSNAIFFHSFPRIMYAMNVTIDRVEPMANSISDGSGVRNAR